MKTVYLPPGIYPMTILGFMYPPDKYRIVITKDGKPPKRKKSCRKAKAKRRKSRKFGSRSP